jgi:hypothetical protein
MYGDMIGTVVTLAVGAIGMGVLYALGIKVIRKEKFRQESADADRRMRF